MKIIFEKFRVINLPQFVWYRYIRKFQICAFNFDHDYHTNWIIRRLIRRGEIVIFNTLESTPQHKKAIDLVKALEIERFEVPLKYLRTLKLSKMDLENVFKKNIVRSVFIYLEISAYLSREREANFVPGVHFLSAGRMLKTNPCAITPFGKANYYLENLKWRFGTSLFFLMQSLIGYSSNQSSQVQRFKYAFSISSLFQIKFEGKRSFDFMLDGSNISKDNSVFVIECDIPDAWIKQKTTEGYNFIKIQSPRKIFTLTDRKLLMKDLLDLIFNRSHDFSTLKSYLTVVYVAGIWKTVFQKVQFENYIYTNNESPSQIAKNGYFRSLGIKSWNYSSFAGGAFLYSQSDDFSSHCQILWSFQNPTHYLLVNSDVQRYYELHALNTDHFHVIGNIYSTLIYEYRKELDRQTSLVEYFPSIDLERSKVITFLDTTFICDDTCHTTFKDGIQFYEDILWLLREFPDLYVILKPSKSHWFYISPDSEWSNAEVGPILVRVMEEVNGHSRACSIGDKGNLPIACALSDLVVTHCLSSPTVEALGAGVPSIWYESGNKHRHTYYVNVPNLIIHGREQLREIASKMFGDSLPKGSEDGFKIYNRIAGSIDGSALHATRDLLSR